MAKDTVRYPDEVVEAIDELVDDGMFESKSEFYRFSAEYVLTLLNNDHDVKTFNFDEIKTELDISEEDHAKALGADGGTFFLDAVITVRKHGLRGDYEAAERFIDTHYESTDQECIILEELLGTYRSEPT
ncbi:putative transcriptional regulator, CopG/Arc/MetJ family (plasmid) [Haloterrigena turkmenica DSM 5511]|uniref:Transcriptional regulator, CopG/Arc/MetJ family n=1 Tax=Haloterrigena turkmenica (strain ATCC 51198 / DSM 5511 / JCM 9101 / NCIMB 13204 / VKM B-1734 / 4k) TaxID=543526 RepID=D2S397_HALTV|nr:CopG family transcriptional regulator [Haloterrigena turkmenica]ADB63844.1 putative transcriptional regulator, CopG/Arc/MetJ family [Haloterrigena turkmenica DSM 5511]